MDTRTSTSARSSGQTLVDRRPVASDPARVDPPLSDCPGCGLTLAISDIPVDPRRNASSACWQLYMTVVGHELTHAPQLGGLHQLSVDAYGAQHTGPQVPAMRTAFALIGLHLALDAGWSGNAVRAAHQYLAAQPRDWPHFATPQTRAALTIAHVARSQTPEEHATRVRAWAASVWDSWSTAHEAVREWANQTLDSATRARLGSA